jgi:hypothetical protein
MIMFFSLLLNGILIYTLAKKVPDGQSAFLATITEVGKTAFSIIEGIINMIIPPDEKKVSK